MATSRSGACLASVVLALLAAAPAQPSGFEPSYDRYLSPGEMVEIEPGRAINLRCEGEGGPTILLEAGLGFPSISWRDAQPRLARFARTCAYDRAGLGFSDAGPMPRSAAAIVDDLLTLVERAGLKPPFVLVGNSLGGQIVRLFAHRRPDDVAGLVLLDPYIEGQFRAFAGIDPSIASDLAELERREAECVSALRESLLSAETAVNLGCISGPNPTFSPALNALLQWQRMQGRWFEAAYSESRMLDTENEVQLRAAERSLGSVPIIILSASQNFSAPRFERTGLALLEEQERLYAALASCSRAGEVRRVDAGHVIQTSDPAAVVVAVHDILKRISR